MVYAGFDTGGSPSTSLMVGGSGRLKRPKRYVTWGEKKRAGMSFLIVIAFFAVFALIILTEILMIDEKSHGTSMINRHGGVAYSRFGESIPDYEDVKEEYSIEEAMLLRNNRFIKDTKRNRHVQISMNNPIRIDSMDRNAANAIPWGSLLPPTIERTLPVYPKPGRPTDGIWKVVNGTRFKFFVYSAFYDRRGGQLIKVIGATKTRGPEKVWCRMWYPMDFNSTTYRSVSVMARVKVIRENWNLKYSACFVLCPINTAGLDLPYAISIVSKIRSPPGNILLVRNMDGDPDFGNRSHIIRNIPNKISICVKPFHFNYDSALHLLEFLELNALLGVSHFTFYNHTLGPHASCVLKHYMDAAWGHQWNSSLNGSSSLNWIPHPTVNLLPWDLHMRSQKEIRTEGLFAALNDCLYRSMYRYQYVALVDLDEYIIPRYNDTLNDLLSWLSHRINNANTGAYSFQNAFFYLQFADDDSIFDERVSSALRAALVTQRKTRRRFKLHPQKQRSKYICKPEAVVEAGNHFVWEFIPGRGSLNVPADAGILHHYRVCEFGGDDCIKTPSVTDRTAQKYGRRLVDRVDAVYNQLKEQCQLDDIPAAPTRPAPTRKKVLRIKEPFAPITDSDALAVVSRLMKPMKVQSSVDVNVVDV